jgi:chemotaxis response regulator CheB
MDTEARYQAMVVGASLGGVEALRTVLGGLRRELPVPVLVAQHLPPGVSQLDERLAHPTGRLWSLAGCTCARAVLSCGWSPMAP